MYISANQLCFRAELPPNINASKLKKWRRTTPPPQVWGRPFGRVGSEEVVGGVLWDLFFGLRGFKNKPRNMRCNVKEDRNEDNSTTVLKTHTSSNHITHSYGCCKNVSIANHVPLRLGTQSATPKSVSLGLQLFFSLWWLWTASIVGAPGRTSLTSTPPTAWDRKFLGISGSHKSNILGVRIVPRPASQALRGRTFLNRHNLSILKDGFPLITTTIFPMKQVFQTEPTRLTKFDATEWTQLS